MSNEVVIKAEGVSKKFSRDLRHVMAYGVRDIARNVIGMSANPGNLRAGEFWALDDVSFEVNGGETLGIIEALIEVGAGFHPMLTGRENIYVNGAILELNKSEIDRKLDAIINFADIGEFIDSPVKHFSSVMYVRLGFAIAVHSEPEILLVDEVLAAGDMRFQLKSNEKLSIFRIPERQ